jgi:nitroimidazol reductase NimA-like FMN-containing flavoprotein (pyridoxamine 5'-phosphate oxidase superfamily)
MRRHDKEIKDEKIILDILQNSELCRLGLVENNEAYIVPLNFGYKDGIIYMHSAPHGRKMEVLKRNNQVAFEIEYGSSIITGDNACKYSARYRSVMGKGTVSIVTGIEAKKGGLDIIMDKYGFQGNKMYDEASLSRMIVLELKIESITGKQSGVWE